MKTQEIKEALSALLSEIEHCDDKYREDEIRSWLMAATLRIWAGNRLFSEDYVKALPDIVNIGLHFFLKNVRPYAASCSEA